MAKLVGSAWQTYTYDCTGTSFRLDGLEPGLEYRFLVQAYVDGSWSAFDDSDVVSVTYGGKAAVNATNVVLTQPDKPVSVHAVAGNGSVTLQWSNPEVVPQSYVVYREELGTNASVTNNTGVFDLVAEGVQSTSYTVNGLTNGRCYKFLIQSKQGDLYSAYDINTDIVSCIPTANTAILGTSQVSHARLLAGYSMSGGDYPSDTWDSSPTIDSFITQIEEAATSQGVRAEVLYAQVMLETNYLHFGGDVKPEQCNFGGIGATGGGNPGNSFDSVKEGLTAQAQHLRLYAGESPLGTLLDPRSFESIRGLAPDVEHLTGSWAMNSSYGASLIAIMEGL